MNTELFSKFFGDLSPKRIAFQATDARGGVLVCPIE
jgi:hypothetical protein